MDVKCPECGSRQFVKFNGQFLCCSCSREFGPKCPECGSEMNPSFGNWLCPDCHQEVDSSDIELPKVDPSVYRSAAKKNYAKKNSSKSSGSNWFMELLKIAVDDITDRIFGTTKK